MNTNENRLYRIDAMAVANHDASEQALSYGGRSDRLLKAVAYVFLLTDEDGRYHLVDTGVRDPDEINVRRIKEHYWVVHPEQTLLAQLQAHHIDPAEVRTVLLTHLHYDHCSQVALFPNADVVLSRAEWQSVMSPVHPSLLNLAGYPRDVYAWMTNSAWSRLKLVEDGDEVLPGVHALVLGGHTPGSTGYLVPAQYGRLVIAGDVINMFENWEHAIPPGLVVNLADWFLAYDRLRQLKVPIVPAQIHYLPFDWQT